MRQCGNKILFMNSVRSSSSLPPLPLLPLNPPTPAHDLPRRLPSRRKIDTRGEHSSFVQYTVKLDYAQPRERVENSVSCYFLTEKLLLARRIFDFSKFTTSWSSTMLSWTVQNCCKIRLIINIAESSHPQAGWGEGGWMLKQNPIDSPTKKGV